MVGDKLWVDGDNYVVVGKVCYRNKMDSQNWVEYRIFHEGTHTEKWLSVDEAYHEYSISWVTRNASLDGFHQVDSGTEIVIAAWGNVDVEHGDLAAFIEYEDATEEKIVSIEVWDDGEERSEGYYLDADEIRLLERGKPSAAGIVSSMMPSSSSSDGLAKGIVVVMALFFITSSFLPSLFGTITDQITPSISKYLKKTYSYTYVTSVTGRNKQKADVYETRLDPDQAAKLIIRAIDGKTESVQQNAEDGDGSIAILTKKEYCILYKNADTDRTMIQISSRKYTYGSDTYSSYSDTIRQASVAARQSSGGGTSYGK